MNMPEFKFLERETEESNAKVMETWASLLEAIEEAGGYLPSPNLRKMSVEELISRLGPNNIKFHYKHPYTEEWFKIIGDLCTKFMVSKYTKKKE